MKKTYKLLNHSTPMSASDIRQLYNGYWVYIVNADFSERGELISGIPVVIGAMAADGAEDGIYDKYKADEYEIRADLNLLPNKGFVSSLRATGAIIG